MKIFNKELTGFSEPPEIKPEKPVQMPYGDDLRTYLDRPEKSGIINYLHKKQKPVSHGDILRILFPNNETMGARFIGELEGDGLITRTEKVTDSDIGLLKLPHFTISDKWRHYFDYKLGEVDEDI